MACTALHCTALYCTALHCIELPRGLSLHCCTCSCTALLWGLCYTVLKLVTSLHCIGLSLLYIILHSTHTTAPALHCTELRCHGALHCTIVHYIALHTRCAALPDALPGTLHCTALPYIVLQSIDTDTVLTSALHNTCMLDMFCYCMFCYYMFCCYMFCHYRYMFCYKPGHQHVYHYKKKCYPTMEEAFHSF